MRERATQQNVFASINCNYKTHICAFLSLKLCKYDSNHLVASLRMYTLCTTNQVFLLMSLTCGRWHSVTLMSYIHNSFGVNPRLACGSLAYKLSVLLFLSQYYQ